MGEPFSDRLRRAIRESAISRYVISGRTGIAQSTLSKFVHGERGLSLGSIDRLMDCLGLEIQPRRKRKDT
ncbi:MAG: helix-turn-helix domain-containing protein [Isosphaerales bacterium]